MFIEQIYTECLAEASYYIESDQIAVIIDPMRDVDKYLELAEKRGAKIKYIFETHFHADFVSGHIDLAKKTGATIVYGPTAKPEYDVYVAKDEEIFQIGSIKIKVLHTPGHTLESSSFLLIDENEKHHSIFTGDTLFVGDVGRPDLAVKSDLSRDDLASMLFHSLNNKIKLLEDDVILYPGHGAGSSCGKNISTELSCTIGKQKLNNYALKIENVNDFVQAVTDGLSEPPNYFFYDATINKSGYDTLDSVLKKTLKPLSYDDLTSINKGKTLLLDTREVNQFEKGFIPGSINIGLEGQYASWVGSLIDHSTPLIIISEDDDKAKESIIRLARIGYENIKGYLKGGFHNWKKEIKPIQKVNSINPSQIETNILNGFNIIDVRRKTEYDLNHIKAAKNIPLDELSNRINEFDKKLPTMIYCLGGYRSMIASSILKSKGIENIINIYGGFREIEKEKLEFSQQ